MAKLYYSVKEYNELKAQHDVLEQKASSLQAKIEELEADASGSEMSVETQTLIQQLNTEVETLTAQVQEKEREISALKKTPPPTSRTTATTEVDSIEDAPENKIQEVGNSLFEIVKSANIQ